MPTATAPTFLTGAPRVLVFDSGVGGLSIAAEIQQRLPQVQLIYASDNAAFPYGTKTETELITRVDLVISRLLQEFAVDILVVACNTASTLTLPHLRSKFTLPIIGVVPAIKPAAEQTRTGVIGLLATPATIVRPYTLELIRNYAPNCTVISIGSRELVELAEQKLRGETISPLAITSITQQFLLHAAGARMDKLVLACTHFPLLRTEIAVNLPKNIELIDSGAAIARRLEHLLQTQPLLSSQQRSPIATTAIFTQHSAATELLAHALKSFDIHQQVYLHV